MPTRSAKEKAAKRSPGRLSAYREKRDFTKTPEPRPKVGQKKAWRFAVQRHDARRLHFDLRLELDGVLKSWAQPISNRGRASSPRSFPAQPMRTSTSASRSGPITSRARRSDARAAQRHPTSAGSRAQSKA